MRTLVIDCATQALSIALLDQNRCLAARHEIIGRGHAEALVPMIGEMLGGETADSIVVDVGPGSFTGIRVGIAAARAFGFAWGVPVSGYESLSLCAAMVRDRGGVTDGDIAIVMLGGHGELFWQRFAAGTLECVTPLTSTPVADLASCLADERVYGSGAAALVKARGWGEAVEYLPEAACYSVLPPIYRGLPPTAVYGRDADAKPMAGVSEGAR